MCYQSDRRYPALSPGFEILIRIGGAAAVFTAMALWEWRLPRRQLTAGRRPRWPANLGILELTNNEMAGGVSLGGLFKKGGPFSIGIDVSKLNFSIQPANSAVVKISLLTASIGVSFRFL